VSGRKGCQNNEEGWSVDSEWVDQGGRRVGRLGDKSKKSKKRVANGKDGVGGGTPEDCKP
jgi:hypothetical protein